MMNRITPSNLHVKITALFRLIFCLLITAILTIPLDAAAAKLDLKAPKGSAEVASVNGQRITLADLPQIDDRLAGLEFQWQQQKFQLIEAELNQLIQDRLLTAAAAAQGMTQAQLITTEVNQKINITDQDISDWYTQNRERLNGAKLSDLSPKIKQFLYQSEYERLLKNLVQQIEAENSVVYQLEPIRANLDVNNAPIIGSQTAPVTVVEFLDYECPFCRKFVETLSQIEQNYGEKVRFVYRQYPLNIHPNAFKAAEAALCAHDQDKFAEMHSLLLAESIGIDELKDKAERLGLNMAQFQTCLDSNLPAQQIQRDMQQGNRWGITGTPTVFINGIPISSSALSYEEMTKVIDQEIQRIE